MKTIREIALTSYYPYGRNKEKIIAKRIFDIDEAIDKHNEQIRADARREFAEWLVRKNGYLNLFNNDSNVLLAEYEKERAK